MRLLHIAAFILLSSLPLAASAGESDADSSKVKVRFAYDLDFDMQFDNREFYKSDFTTSMTIFGARLTPAVGVSLEQKNGVRHRLMTGIDVMKDFGAAPVPAGYAPADSPDADPRLNNLNLFKEISLYYSVSKQLGKTGFEMVAGVFPRRFSEGSYSQAFFSDSLRFYDNNLEGLLLKFKRPQAYFEVGCDWMGMTGRYRKERFMIFTSGEGKVLPFLSLGYAAYLYHFAGAEVSPGVVDNAWSIRGSVSILQDMLIFRNYPSVSDGCSLFRTTGSMSGNMCSRAAVSLLQRCRNGMWDSGMSSLSV